MQVLRCCDCSRYRVDIKGDMSLDLYYFAGSAPCRAVLLTAKALGIELNLKPLDLLKGEHLTPEYVKINPQHTIPTLVDNGFILWESRAIMAYLADQYGKDDSLYPKDPKKRAIVDQRLYFDIGTMYAKFGEVYYPVLFGGVDFDASKLDKVNDAFKFLDLFLENQDFVAGNQLTLGDLSLLATVTTLEAVNFDLVPYKNVTAWLTRTKQAAPGYDEANGQGLVFFKQLAENLHL